MENRTPDDGELYAIVYGTEDEPGREVEARGLNQGAALVQHGNDLDALGHELAALDALDGEVIDPERVEDVPARRVPRVIEHRDHDGRRGPRRGEAFERAVLPDWLTSRSALVGSTSWACRYYGKAGAFHGVRLPLYALRVAARSPWGAARITAAVWRWVADSEHRDARRALLTSGVTAEGYLRIREERRNQARGRAFVAGSGLAVLASGGVVAAQADPMTQAIAVAASLGVLGLVGRAKDGRITSRAMDKAEAPRLTADLIAAALTSLGLSSINGPAGKDPKAIRFLALVRDGAGFRADIDLPAGATAAEVMDRREKLASGLQRHESQVWPERDPEAHAGRLVLWVGDRPLSKARPAPWPLVKAGRTNVFTPIPLGVDHRGRKVTTTLMYASGVVGAVPRMGKTFSLRLIELAAALDPRVELHVFDMKGGADHLPLADVAHAFRAGDEPEDIAFILADLKALVAEMRRRYKVLRGLPREVCPESKVTDELAGRRELALHPIFLAIDETQIAFEHPDHGSAISDLVTDLVKRGPAAGIMVWCATQRPDAKSIPVGIKANAILRLCLKVSDHTANDMVLGTGAYSTGIRATMFSRSDLGTAWLAGEGDDPVIVRTSYVDADGAAAIAARARVARAAAGRLTGMAAGETPADLDLSSVLDHLIAAWPGTEPKVWADELAARLTEHLPGVYAGWTAQNVTTALKPYGIRAVQHNRVVDGRQVNKRAIARNDVLAALGNTIDTPHDDKED
ncbi:hypothetical protein L1785_14500 [Antribacter sp. KLBMP9083]|uniref:FtsK domain-containing protein n=1 Tax=Antribacter soli TaxID=2910976 RepID=A0AA41U7N0_9MICO|nr:FtsK/SpoIIIE domain-containing protein [Antribacter soli]MCF4122188.1 hypothetical protein [Antribacter soli]